MQHLAELLPDRHLLPALRPLQQREAVADGERAGAVGETAGPARFRQAAQSRQTVVLRQHGRTREEAELGANPGADEEPQDRAEQRKEAVGGVDRPQENLKASKALISKASPWLLTAPEILRISEKEFFFNLLPKLVKS